MAIGLRTYRRVHDHSRRHVREEMAVGGDEASKVGGHKADRVVATAKLGLGGHGHVKKVAGVGVEAVGVLDVVRHDLKVVNVQMQWVRWRPCLGSNDSPFLERA